MPEKKKKEKKMKTKKQSKSSLSQFVERPVPNEKEVESFERVIKKEARNQEIETNLSEIYRDKKGKMINVKTLKKKKKQVYIIRLFRRLLIAFIVVAALYFSYLFFFSTGNDSSALEFEIIAPEKIIAGEEFTYSLEYLNPSKFALEDIHLEVQYPENFIFVGSSIVPDSGNYAWNLPTLRAGERASLTIIGKLIASPESVNIISARLNYVPTNFSSSFKKEASNSTVISGLGFRVDLDSNNTAFIGQESEMTLTFSEVENNYFGNFNLSLVPSADVEVGLIVEDEEDTEEEKVKVEQQRGLNWEISEINQEIERFSLPIFFKVKEDAETAEVVVKLEKKMDDGQAYIFWEEIIAPDLVKSDLNLTLSLNDSQNDQALNFGQNLNYTLSYSNKGENSFEDVLIMMVLESDFLDWDTLDAKVKPERRDNALIWTKEELEELAEIEANEEGNISFSISLKDFSDDDFGQDLSLKSYAQYSFNNKPVKGDENKSNTISGQINSDLNLQEKIRYFDEDNIPVGSGPLPPRVGEKTGFKVYWTVKNNLHELNDVRVVLDLPSYVAWDGKSSTNVGSLSYSSDNHQVTWDVGRLPVSVYQTDAEFGISVTPNESDLNKILVLTTGATISAVDTETNDSIRKKGKAKTTKLEDDDIANLNNSGIVE